MFLLLPFYTKRVSCIVSTAKFAAVLVFNSLVSSLLACSTTPTLSATPTPSMSFKRSASFLGGEAQQQPKGIEDSAVDADSLQFSQSALQTDEGGDDLSLASPGSDPSMQVSPDKSQESKLPKVGVDQAATPKRGVSA